MFAKRSYTCIRLDLRILLIALDLYHTRRSVAIDDTFSIILVILLQNISGIACNSNDDADDTTDSVPETS